MSGGTDAATAVTPGDADWASAGRTLSWVTAAAFVLAAILYLLLAFDIVAPAPTPNPSLDFVGTITASFEYQARVRPVDIAATATFALGFLALGALGLVLGRLLRGGASATLGGAAFAVGSVLGAASQLVYLGGGLVATNPQYCDCVYRPEQVVSQLTGLQIILGIQSWMLAASFVVLAAGMLLVAVAAPLARWPSSAWTRLSQGLAVFLVLIAVVTVLQTTVDLGVLPRVMVLLGAGILLPLWVLWLARQLRSSQMASRA